MVAVAAARLRGAERSTGWLAGGLAVLLVGTLVRLAVRPIDTAAVSAALMAALLWLGAWLVAWLVSTPRRAFAVAVAAMLVLDLAALPARTLVEYDDVQALHRTDQTLRVRVPPSSPRVLTVQVEPVFSGPEPRFGLAGEFGDTRVEWSCPLRRGLQRVVLPLPRDTTEVNLRVTGSPSREGEYLLVYTWQRGEPGGDAVVCH